MSTGLLKAGVDVNNWLKFNNFFYAQTQNNEYLDIQLNSNNPPTVKQGTRFVFYNTDNTFTIPNSTTGDNEYGANDTITYLVNEAIFEDGGDLSFTWAGSVRGETIATQSDNTWYLYCTGSYNQDQTTIGQGVYNFSTNAPTYSEVKGGWYSSDGKVIAKFTSSGGTVANLIILGNNISRGTIAPDFTPGKIGQFYLDTTTNYIYYSTGTSSSADWITDVLTGSTAPASTPVFVGQKYIDTTGNREYYATGTSSSADWKKTARYDYGTTTVTAGGGDVTVNLDFDWTDGQLCLFISGTAADYVGNGVTGIKLDTTYDSITNGSYTNRHSIVHNGAASGNYHSINAITTNSSGNPKSATTTSFTLDDDGATTVYVKWTIIA